MLNIKKLLVSFYVAAFFSVVYPSVQSKKFWESEKHLSLLFLSFSCVFSHKKVIRAKVNIT